MLDKLNDDKTYYFQILKDTLIEFRSAAGEMLSPAFCMMGARRSTTSYTLARVVSIQFSGRILL